MHEVYISTSQNDSRIFDEKVGYALLEELSLAGKIVSIGPGDDPIPCCSSMIIFLDTDSKVQVCDPKEYY